MCDAARSGWTLKKICSGFGGDPIKAEIPTAPKATPAFFDEWGFAIGTQAVMCMGQAVDLKNYEKAQNKEMTKAMIGGQFSQEMCEGNVKLGITMALKKQRLLASMAVEGGKKVGCDVEKYAQNDKEETKKCAEMWKEYALLHSDIYNAGGTIKEDFDVFTPKFRSYGKTGPTICVEVGMCDMEDIESTHEYMRTLKLKEKTGEDENAIIRPPGRMNQKAVNAVAAAFSFGPGGNVMYNQAT